MPRSGEKTRERIIDAAEALVYRHGFAGASVEKIIERAGVTKGAFFHHFSNKGALGRVLVKRYAERDLAHLERAIARADRLGRDPRERLSILVGLIAEDLSGLPDPIPGCLVTSYLYERAEYPADVADIARQLFDRWCVRMAGKIADAAGPASVLDAEGFARTLLALIEGGFVIAKAQNDGAILSDLLCQFRDHLEDSLVRAASAETHGP